MEKGLFSSSMTFTISSITYVSLSLSLSECCLSFPHRPLLSGYRVAPYSPEAASPRGHQPAGTPVTSVNHSHITPVTYTETHLTRISVNQQVL